MVPAAARLPIAPDYLAELCRWARCSQLPAVLAQRAQILLLAADGTPNTEIAERVGVSRPTVITCRHRYVRRGLDGLPDRPRPGRPQTVRRTHRAEILKVTLNPPPPGLGITHWSTRLLARELGVSRDSIARVWREYGVRPWHAETFKFSTDPQLATKVHDVVGLDLHPPARGVVLCVDEKSQIQALERTQPVRRVWLDRPEQRTHDDTGTARRRCSPRSRSRPGASSTSAPTPPPPGVSGLPQAGRPGLPTPPAARDLRQLRHRQAPGRARLAGQAPAHRTALHADLGVMAELGRGVLLTDLNYRDRSLLCCLEPSTASRLLGPSPRTRSSPSSTVKRLGEVWDVARACHHHDDPAELGSMGLVQLLPPRSAGRAQPYRR
jgi:transposase